MRLLLDTHAFLWFVTIRHAAVLSRLPMHHKDPFDRMIVSQGIAEKMAIVSADAALDLYEIQRLW